MIEGSFKEYGNSDTADSGISCLIQTIFRREICAVNCRLSN